jgi:hypothetical protein
MYTVAFRGYSTSQSKRTRRRAAASAVARQGEADKVIFDLERELHAPPGRRTFGNRDAI